MLKKCQEGLTRIFNWYMDLSLVQVIEGCQLLIDGFVSIFKYVSNERAAKNDRIPPAFSREADGTHF